MECGDDMVDGYISSILVVESLKLNENGDDDDVSPEDITWADSCLVKDPDISSDGDWSRMKDALIEILGLQHDDDDSVGSPMTHTDMEILQSAKPRIVNFSRRSNAAADDGDVSFTGMNNDEIMETANQYSLSQHFRDISQTSLGNVSIRVDNEEMDEFRVEEEEEEEARYPLLTNPFLPNYREEDIQETMMSSHVNDAFSSSMYENEQEIFKVWDLGIQPEDDELYKQLTKVLSESSDQLVVASTPDDDSRAYKDLEEQSLDDLTAGLADLSLNHYSN